MKSKISENADRDNGQIERVVSLPPERFPKCNNNKCCWNMGKDHITGYSYLDNTCYHNSDAVEYNKCKERSN